MRYVYANKIATSFKMKEIISRRRLINQSYSKSFFGIGESDIFLLASGIDQEHFDYLHTDRGIFSLITFYIRRKNAAIIAKTKKCF